MTHMGSRAINRLPPHYTVNSMYSLALLTAVGSVHLFNILNSLLYDSQMFLLGFNSQPSLTQVYPGKNILRQLWTWFINTEIAHVIKCLP